MHGIYAHARFDDLALNARSQWVGKGIKSELNYIPTSKQALSINPFTTVGHFVCDLVFVYLSVFLFIFALIQTTTKSTHFDYDITTIWVILQNCVPVL